MTKFEEEIKRPDNGPITELNNNMQKVFSQYRKMRQYADYLEYELKQKDEHILKVENENSFMRDERTTFDSNGNSVEPIIQQQALPVVPECVGKELYNIDFNYWIENKMTLACFTARTLNWLEQHRGDWNIEYYICKLRFGGFTVEKPHLFFLKHIDMSKRNSINDLYLKKYTHADLTETGEHRLSHAMSAKGIYPPKEYCAFTQQEIDSMNTGSYEQIKVEEEK